MIRTLLLTVLLFSVSYSQDLHPKEIERLGGTKRPISNSINRSQLRAPTGPIRNIAEYEPHEAVIVSYSGQFGISLDVIKEINEVAKVYCLTTSSSTVQSQFNSKGITNYEIISHSPDAYWTRDCAPWWIFDGNDDACIIDFNYNRPRPNDNQIPAKMASELQVSRYDMQINHAGGNYMCDGLGKAAATDLVYRENSSYTESQIDDIKKSFLGIEDHITMPDPNLDQSYQIDHIDCWGKFLAPDKIIIRKVPTSNQSYNELEDVAEMFANMTSSYGTKYKVYRVYASQGEPYTNCLIINNKVLIPIKGTSNDAAALQAYRDAMPGYTIVGMSDNGYPDWLSTDALHCRTKGIPDREMLYVGHIPLHDTISISSQSDEIEVKCKVFAHSGQSLKNDSLLLCYKYSYDSYYKTATLTSMGSDSFSANLPLPTASSSVEYYLSASDNSGRRETHPYMGDKDPHTFYVDMGNVAIGEIAAIQKSLTVNANQIGNHISINYQMPTGVSNGSIALFNSKGVKISSIGNLSDAGKINLGNNLSKGVYFLKIKAGDFSQSRSLLLK